MDLSAILLLIEAYGDYDIRSMLDLSWVVFFLAIVYNIFCQGLFGLLIALKIVLYSISCFYLEDSRGSTARTAFFY
jgi:hypothetical protein